MRLAEPLPCVKEEDPPHACLMPPGLPVCTRAGVAWTRHIDALLHSLVLTAAISLLLGVLLASSLDVATAPAVLLRCALALALCAAPWSLAPLAQARRMLAHPRARGAASP